MAAIASRSIMFVEFVAVARFVTNRLLGRRDVHRFAVLAVECLRSYLPRGDLVEKVKDMKDDCTWKKSIDGWNKQQQEYNDLVWKSVAPYSRDFLSAKIW